ncbi:MAG TPA: DEAD/DEAH box helicase [Candidatus Nanoarchaeia archaeon]|nr:DEAD/DEAH box helicase [Candidatus Nanoarchaeia archaeon]
MELDKIKDKLPEKLYAAIAAAGIAELRPSQVKSVEAGLLDGKNLLVCTPTASGKTLIAELAAVSAVLSMKGKAIYVVPLKALATEKYNDFKKRYGSFIRVGISIGDLDSADPYLADYDLIICTAEKLDSLIRHHAPWIRMVAVVVVDEIHVLNDTGRGPTLEILITILRQLLPKVQLIALSATIGNPEELAAWLGAELVVDTWRPVRLHQGVYREGVITFKK